MASKPLTKRPDIVRELARGGGRSRPPATSEGTGPQQGGPQRLTGRHVANAPRKGKK